MSIFSAFNVCIQFNKLLPSECPCKPLARSRNQALLAFWKVPPNQVPLFLTTPSFPT